MSDPGAPSGPTPLHGTGLGPLQAILPRLIEALSDAVVVLDRRARVVAANTRFSEAFGAYGDTVPGRPCPRSGDCDGGPCIACDMAEARAPRRIMQVLRDASGQQRRWEATLSPVLDDAGELHLVVEVWRDITDRTQLEAQLTHSERLASLGLLAAGVAHELNNPLASVLAGVESLQRLVDRVGLPAEEAEEANEILRVLEQGTQRCSETTDKLLLLGQQHSSRPVWVDLTRAAHDTLALLRFATRKQGIVVQPELTEGLAAVWGREGSLRGALMNLCLNAVQAMPSGGRLTVRTRRAGETVVFEVEDDGPGVSPEHLQRIWDPFFTTKPVGQGTGLGLSITRRIVTDHGGEIRVASAPGRGACLTATLPLGSGGGEIG